MYKKSITPLTNTICLACGSCLRFFEIVCSLGSGWVTRGYMQQSCTFCHRNESCFSLPWLLLGGDINDFGQTCRALIVQCARQFQLHAGICVNSEVVLYIQCHQIHGLDIKGHQIRSTSRQPGMNTERTRKRNIINKPLELNHASCIAITINRREARGKEESIIETKTSSHCTRDELITKMSVSEMHI